LIFGDSIRRCCSGFGFCRGGLQPGRFCDVQRARLKPASTKASRPLRGGQIAAASCRGVVASISDRRRRSLPASGQAPSAATARQRRAIACPYWELGQARLPRASSRGRKRQQPAALQSGLRPHTVPWRSSLELAHFSAASEAYWRSVVLVAKGTARHPHYIGNDNPPRPMAR
jgi:hypothetical protein